MAIDKYSGAWGHAFACKRDAGPVGVKRSVPEELEDLFFRGLMPCGGFTGDSLFAARSPDTTTVAAPARDRLQLVTTEVQPTRRAHTKMLKRHARLNTFVRCPACGQRGGVYYLHHPTEVETRWCYQCGYRGGNV